MAKSQKVGAWMAEFSLSAMMGGVYMYTIGRGRFSDRALQGIPVAPHHQRWII
jgi:hypothetical protein